jgi:protease-4
MSVHGTIVGIFRFIWRALDALRKVLHLVVLLVLFSVVLAALQTSIPLVPHGAALLLNPQGRIVEQLSGDPVERAVRDVSGEGEPETLLRDLLTALEAAAEDERIRMVVLDVGAMSGAGLSKLQEIGAALRAFKRSGKKIVAVGDAFEQSQYYLAAQADEVYLDPLGYVFIDGYEYYRMFFKEALAKLAVDVNVFRAGTHKTYTDAFTRDAMSPEEREEALVWLNALWSAYQSDVTSARQLPNGALAAYAAQLAALVKAAKGDTARVAFAQGLVTALKTRDEVYEDLKSIVGEDESTHSFRQIELGDYLVAIHSEEVLRRGSRNKVGVIVASGDILDGYQPPGAIGGDSTVELIREARYDDDVKAVVVRVDSPGGSMFASEQIYRELKAVREAGKPVVVSMSSVAASGGYYIAAAADEIWAGHTTITGSIGVFAAIPTFQDTLGKLGVHVDGVGTTPLSGDFRLDRALGPAARDILQSSVENAYSLFLDRVAESRRKAPAEIDAVGQGRVWSGTDALTRGLVDALGSFDEAVAAAARRADLGEDYEIRDIEPQMSWRQMIAMELRGVRVSLERAFGFGSASARIVRRVLDPVQREIARWARFNDPRHLYSYCFCEVQSRMIFPD